MTISISIHTAAPLVKQSDQTILLCPNGGEVLTWDSTYIIRWFFSGSGNPGVYDYIFSLSIDGGQSYPYPITGPINPDSSTLEWIVPHLNSTACRVLIQIDSSGTNVGWDTSDSNFTICETGLYENDFFFVPDDFKTATIFSGPLLFRVGKDYIVFDITGRVVLPDKIKPGIYFIEVDGKITQKVIKIK